MKSKSMMLWLVALTCGLVAMLGVRQVMNREPVEVAPAIEYGQMLVAIEDIGPGTMLSEVNTTFKDFPLEAIPEGAVTKAEQYQERAILTRAVPGEPIMLAKLGARGVSGASTEIPKGMRVVTVKVNQTTNHSGLMLPGDRVDVMLTFQSREERNGRSVMMKKTKTVLEFIKVFATDSMRERVGESAEMQAKNVSLLVTPEQAQLLNLAENSGQLTLALRSPTDEAGAEGGLIDQSIFEDGDSSFGIADENNNNYKNNLEEAKADEENGGADDIRKFLANEQKEEPKQIAAVAPEVEPEPERPRWSMTIFSGQDSETVDFEYDENGKAVRLESDTPNNYQRAANNVNSPQQTSLPISNPNNF
ncbi:MAG: Flp pilus assembly protein CpaB [Planctomycetaceae bacterium]|nr:Flp pilus assembly protein CpaB [Planctomycetaceae bacterium]